MNKIISYDKENDILVIHKGFSSNEKFKGNIDIGDLILDVSTRERVRGIEIMNASKFFKDFDIKKTMLKDLGEAQFTATIKPDRIIVSIALKAKNVEQEMPIKVAVPLAIPIRH